MSRIAFVLVAVMGLVTPAAAGPGVGPGGLTGYQSPPPAPVTDLAVDAAGMATWTAPADTDVKGIVMAAQGYQIGHYGSAITEANAALATWTWITPHPDRPGTVQQFHLRAIAIPEGRRWISIRSADVEGQDHISAVSNPVEVTLDFTAPGAVTLQAAAAGQATLLLSWTRPATNNDIAEVSFEVSLHAHFPPAFTTATPFEVIPAANTRLLDVPAFAGRIVNVRCIARDPAQNAGLPSNEVSTTLFAPPVVDDPDEASARAASGCGVPGEGAVPAFLLLILPAFYRRR